MNADNKSRWRRIMDILDDFSLVMGLAGALAFVLGVIEILNPSVQGPWILLGAVLGAVMAGAFLWLVSKL